MTGKRKKSDQRWHQFNYLMDEVIPRLKNNTAAVVLLTCFRYGRGPGIFRSSVRTLAKASRTSISRVREHLDRFVRDGLLELLEERKGTIPRTYRIRFIERDDRVWIEHRLTDKQPRRRKASGTQQSTSRRQKGKT